MVYFAACFALCRFFGGAAAALVPSSGGCLPASAEDDIGVHGVAAPACLPAGLPSVALWPVGLAAAVFPAPFFLWWPASGSAPTCAHSAPSPRRPAFALPAAT